MINDINNLLRCVEYVELFGYLIKQYEVGHNTNNPQNEKGKDYIEVASAKILVISRIILSEIVYR